MPYDSASGAYIRRATTILDETPDGDTVNTAVAGKLDTTADDSVTDLNHHRVNGGHYPSPSVSSASRYLKQAPSGAVTWAEGVPIEQAALKDLSNVPSGTTAAINITGNAATATSSTSASSAAACTGNAATANMSDTLRQGGLSAPTSAGTGAAYTVASSPAVAAYVSGRVYQFVAHTACSGAPTVNFDGLGAKSIKVISDGSKAPCAAADIAVGQLATCLYDGTDMVLIAWSRRAKGFQAIKTADQTGIASATPTKVTFPSEIEDTDGWYNAATSEFTPPAGVYLIEARLQFSAGVVDGSDFRVILNKNGSTFRQKLVVARGTVTVHPDISCFVKANGTDVFTVYAYGAGAGTKTVAGEESTTTFSAYKVE